MILLLLLLLDPINYDNKLLLVAKMRSSENLKTKKERLENKKC